MNVATIVPQNYLHLTKNDNYFMCLGNLIGAPGMEKYTEFFRKRAEEEKFVIMDNGVIEGNQRPIEELVAKANLVGASEIVLTDVFRDKEATLNAIDHDMHALEGLTRPPRLMMVPQGNSIEEWVDCAHQLICKYRASLLVITFGVPKVLVLLGGRDARALALKQLMVRCPIARHCTFHLLGCWTTALEVTVVDKLGLQGAFPIVRGVDSAMPFVYARAGKLITHQDRPDSVPINFKKTRVNPFKLYYNLYHWRRAADASREFL